MAPHSSTFAWKILWTEEPGRPQSMGSLESDTTEWLHFHFSLSCIGEGNGNPLQCSCLENPKDREAWWADVYGVAQSRKWLKWFSSSSSSNILLYKSSTLAPCPSLCINLSPVPRSCVFSSNTVVISASYWNSPPNTGILHVLRCFALHYLS